VPGALALAGKWFGAPGYLEVARAAARQYYEREVKRGLTTGGPGEILSAPDSESAYAMMDSFVLLYEATGEPEWLKAAHDMVRLLATWCVSYDYVFPETSDLGRSGARTTGAVWANLQNKHGAPAICTASGDSLFKYWRASGDGVALELLRDLVRGLPQYLSRPDRQFNPRMKPGWMCERVNLSDWEGRDAIGNNLFGSCWAEISLMLATIELPGVYVQPDTGKVVVFDQVEAEVTARSKGTVKLKLTNPTKYPAEVRVLSETSKETASPLGLNSLLKCRSVAVPAGGSTMVELR